MGCQICQRPNKDVKLLVKTPKGNKICDGCIDDLVDYVGKKKLEWSNEKQFGFNSKK